MTGSKTHLAGVSLESAGGRMHLAGGPTHLAGARMHLAGGRTHFAGGQMYMAGGLAHLAGASLESAGGSMHLAGASSHFAGAPLQLVAQLNLEQKIDIVASQSPSSVNCTECLRIYFHTALRTYKPLIDYFAGGVITAPHFAQVLSPSLPINAFMATGN